MVPGSHQGGNMSTDVFGARGTLQTSGGPVVIYRLSALEQSGVASALDRLPFSIKILLEAPA